MTSNTVDTSPQLHARIAGASYFVGALLSVLGQMVILSKIVVSGNAAATVANILSHDTLFRLGFVLSVMTVPFHLVWAVLFNGLFRPVNRSVASLAVFIMVMACVMWTLSSLLYFAPLLLLQGKIAASAFTPEQLQALVLTLFKWNALAYDIGLVFFGFWYVLIGYLIFKSTFLPRIVGALGVVAGFGYLTLLWQPLSHFLYPYNLALAGPGEISLILWLIVKGVNVGKWKETAGVGQGG
jgi:hypothetical protein